MTGRFEYMSNLQYKVKALTAQLALFESGEKYIKMKSAFGSQLAEKDREIRRLKLELADANCRTVTVRILASESSSFSFRISRSFTASWLLNSESILTYFSPVSNKVSLAVKALTLY